MRTPIRLLLPALATLALGACFDPAITSITADGPDTETGTDGPSPDSTGGTTDLDGAEGPLDSTGTVDNPPEITAFTVNGSTMPAELQLAGMVVFDVDAIDDIGIDHVEIYDGNTLVATADASPYRAEILVSSADNGTHSYSAIAVDTAGQTDESGVVPLSVNVLGGAILELRENIGDVQVAIFGMGSPKLTTLSDGKVVVTGQARLSAVPVIRTGLLARGYNPGLSLLWSTEHEPSPMGMATDYTGFSAPSPSPSAPIVYVGGQSRFSANNHESTVFALDTQSGTLADRHVLWPSTEQLTLPVAAEPGGDVFASASLAEVGRYSEDFSVEHWRSAPQGLAVLELTSTPQGEVMAVFFEAGCAMGGAICLRKLSPMGAVLWTRFVTVNTEAGLPTRPAVSSVGHIAIAAPLGDGSITLLVFDPQGDELSNTVLSASGALHPHDIAYTASDDLVVGGTIEDAGDYAAWATRVEEDGTEIWNQTYSIGTTDSVVSGVTTSPSGRLYATGTANLFAQGFLTHGARAWVAEMAL